MEYMEYNINLGMWGGVFAVPDSIVDEYIKLATGENLKILLYCLRYSGQGLSAGEISRATGVAPDNVTSSFDFWKQRGLFSDSPPPVTAESFTAEETPTMPDKTKLVMLERDYSFSPKEISDIIKDNKDVQYIFEHCEKLYGRSLKHAEHKALSVIIEEIGMKPSVTLMLIEYCFSVDKTTTRYIKAVAKDWVEQDINSVEAAEAHIRLIKEGKTKIKSKKAKSDTPASFDLDELDKQIMEGYKKS
jgi:DnaD/phage-associated family protein